MKILRAEQLGMCFGVRDAIALAVRETAHAPLTVLGDLVHNETVLADLRRRGVRIENDLSNVGTRTVMITAHGTSERVREQVRQRGLNMLEATCPLVRVAHDAVLGLARHGYHPVIIGKREHVEVRGLTGDLREFDVVANDADIAALAERLRFGVAAQTTQPIDKVEHLVESLRQRFPMSEVKFVDTVCRPTKQNQAAATELARQCDVVVVVGGAHSNNTRELVEACRRDCAHVFHVTDADGLSPDWLAEANVVGLTAGTSTPDSVIDAVEARLKAIASVERIPVSA